VFLIIVGLLIAFGRLQRFNILLFAMAGRLQGWDASHPLLARGISASLFAVAAAWGLWLALRRGRRGLRPWAPLTVALLLVVLAAATLAGFVSPVSVVAFWLTYQGI
jgi:hypothetical protein